MRRAFPALVCAAFVASAKISVQGDRMLNWQFTEVAVVTGASASDPFANVRSVATDGNSRFAVLDRTALRIHVFNSDGVHQWSAARAGDGPGELRSPLSVNSGGDATFLVTDQSHQRVSRYGPNGAFLGDVSLPGSDRYMFENTFVAGWFYSLRLQQDDPTQTFRQRLIRWRPDSSSLVSTYDFKLRPRVTKTVCPGLNASNDQRPLYEPELLWSTNGSTVAWRGGWADYRVRIRELNGAERDLRRDIQPARVTEPMAIAADGGRERTTGNCTYDRTDVVRARGWAQTRPVIQRIAVQPDGSIWVSRFSSQADTLIDVFDASGAYAGTLPRGTKLPDGFLANGRVLYRSVPAGGEPTVRIVQITRR